MEKRLGRNRRVRNILFLLIVLGLIISIAVFGYLLMSEKKINEGGVEMSPSQDGKIQPYKINGYRIEYQMPSYLPEELRYPQHFFSGRKLNIINEREENGTGKEIKSDKIKTIKLVKKDLKTNKILEEKGIKTELSKRQVTSAFVIDIPGDLETGYYEIQFDDNGLKSLPIRVNGVDKNTNSQVRESIKLSPPNMDQSIIDIKRLNCGYCFWESVSTISPLDENLGYLVGSDLLVYTADGWRTSKFLNINEITYPSLTFARGDPKLEFTSDGKLLIASLLQDYSASFPYNVITGGIYEQTSLSNLIFNHKYIFPIPSDLDERVWIIFDYEKIAVDKNPTSQFFGTTYMSVNAMRLSGDPFDSENWGTGLVTIKPNGEIIEKITSNNKVGLFQPPQSLLVGKNGVLYAGRSNNDWGHSIFRSLNGGETFSEIEVPNSGLNPLVGCNIARVSTSSKRAWNIYQGPELTQDKNTERLYTAWVKFKECRMDPSFEYENYKYDNDVFISYSDDEGVSWSDPIRVNDDFSGGDQGFPDIEVDENGIVYVVFLDHRDNQNLDQFDVYLSFSINNGETFSKNIKLNDVGVDNVYGGRDPGDYLDMLAVGKDKIYVTYPCMNTNFRSYGRATDACVTIIDKNKLLGIVVDPTFCQSHTYYSSPSSATGQACCFNGQVVNSNTITPGDTYNRFLCYDGQIFSHTHGIATDTWTTNVASCSVKGKYYAYPNYPWSATQQEWQGGWKLGSGQNIICNSGKTCDGKGVCVSTSNTNLIINPDFESFDLSMSPSLWQKGTGATISQSADKFNGVNSVQLTRASGYGYTIGQDFNVQAGETYYFEIYMKKLSGSVAWARIVDPAKWQWQSFVSQYNNGVWQKFSQTVTIPSGITKVRFELGGSSMNALYDGAVLMKVPITASWNNNANYPIINAVDNNINTYYMACSSPGTTYNNGNVIYDLGAIKTLTQINLDFAQSNAVYPGAPASVYTVSISNDKSTWTKVYTQNYVIARAPDISIPINNLQARYVKLEYTKVNDGTGWCLALNEISVK